MVSSRRAARRGLVRVASVVLLVAFAAPYPSAVAAAQPATPRAPAGIGSAPLDLAAMTLRP